MNQDTPAGEARRFAELGNSGRGSLVVALLGSMRLAILVMSLL